MAKKGEIIGLRTVQRNLNREILAIKGRTLEGMIDFAILVRRDMDKTAPLIPIDTGNLRASWFIATVKGNETPAEFESGRFKGKHADEMKSDHASTISEAQSMSTSSREPLLVMGFSANYASFVHEMVGANFAGDPARATRTKKKKYLRRAGAGAKFFEQSIERNKREGLELIRRKAKVR